MFTYGIIFYSNVHPNEQGHRVIAEKFGEALKNWGLQPNNAWDTVV